MFSIFFCFGGREKEEEESEAKTWRVLFSWQ